MELTININYAVLSELVGFADEQLEFFDVDEGTAAVRVAVETTQALLEENGNDSTEKILEGDGERGCKRLVKF